MVQFGARCQAPFPKECSETVPTRISMAASTLRPDLAEMSLAELEQFLAGLGEERFHARQIYQWVYKRGVTEFARMSDLSKGLREKLAVELRLATPRVVAREKPSDGTETLVLEGGTQ